jgi:hypothetical protein
MVEVTRKLGNHRGGKRIWLEGALPLQAGFIAKVTYFELDYDEEAGTLTLWTCPEGTKGSRRVSGKGDRPIIDITGQVVQDFFGVGCELVRVTYNPGNISIRGAVDVAA